MTFGDLKNLPFQDQCPHHSINPWNIMFLLKCYWCPTVPHHKSSFIPWPTDWLVRYSQQRVNGSQALDCRYGLACGCWSRHTTAESTCWKTLQAEIRTQSDLATGIGFLHPCLYILKHSYYKHGFGSFEKTMKTIILFVFRFTFWTLTLCINMDPVLAPISTLCGAY